MMYLRQDPDGTLQLEGSRLSGWLVVLYFGLILGASLLSALKQGDLTQVLVALSCGGFLLVGIPFVAFAISSYPRLLVEPGVRVRLYHVYRGTGPRLARELPWDDIRRLIVREHHGNRMQWVTVTAETGAGDVPLGRFEIGLLSDSTQDVRRAMRDRFGDRFSTVGSAH